MNICSQAASEPAPGIIPTFSAALSQDVSARAVLMGFSLNANDFGNLPSRHFLNKGKVIEQLRKLFFFFPEVFQFQERCVEYPG